MARKDIKNNRYIYAQPNLNYLHPREYYYIDKLFPLKKYNFGALKVWGAKDAEWYVKNCYGENWNKYAVVPPNHSLISKRTISNKRVSEPVVIELTDELRSPAPYIQKSKK